MSSCTPTRFKGSSIYIFLHTSKFCLHAHPHISRFNFHTCLLSFKVRLHVHTHTYSCMPACPHDSISAIISALIHLIDTRIHVVVTSWEVSGGGIMRKEKRGGGKLGVLFISLPLLTTPSLLCKCLCSRKSPPLCVWRTKHIP